MGYHKEYYHKNKERYLEMNKRSREKTIEKRKEYDKKYRQEHREEINEKAKKKQAEKWKRYYEKHKEQHKEKSAKWRESNKEHKKERDKQYRQLNKHIVNANTRNRQARLLERTPCWFNEEDKRLLQELYKWCADNSTKEVLYTVDHIIPLQGRNVSGLHCKSNWQILPKSLNSSKNNKWDIENGS